MASPQKRCRPASRAGADAEPAGSQALRIEPTLGVGSGGQVSAGPAGPKAVDDSFTVVAIDIAPILELGCHLLDREHDCPDGIELAGMRHQRIGDRRRRLEHSQLTAQNAGDVGRVVLDLGGPLSCTAA